MKMWYIEFNGNGWIRPAVKARTAIIRTLEAHGKTTTTGRIFYRLATLAEIEEYFEKHPEMRERVKLR